MQLIVIIMLGCLWQPCAMTLNQLKIGFSNLLGLKIEYGEIANTASKSQNTATVFSPALAAAHPAAPAATATPTAALDKDKRGLMATMRDKINAKVQGV